MGGACGTCERRVHTGFWWGDLKERTTWKIRNRWEGNIKKDLKAVGCGDMDWIDLAQDRNRCWAVVNAVMKLRVS